MTALDLITRDDLQQFKLELFQELGSIFGKDKAESPKKFLRSKEVRKLLDISSGTLLNLRINGTLPFTMIGKIHYYKIQDINKILEANNSTNKIVATHG
ncbi:DNA-binding protein [Pedobacter sp. LMG 31464]|uniref:DNA-binding protein n=1 Tax=Pedobacter planticolens TaxID=2679964 RepID=A0A923IUE1_9SPHI|nr:helix-turn-helix domain-containing protein [Pedobacter planticolens]MBB2145815.1 DNA-binding protein [Pedobacter planticolens]